VCQVAIVVMETTQLVPSQFKKNFFTHQLRIEYGLSLPKIISKRCELIAGIRYCGFLRHSVCGYAMLLTRGIMPPVNNNDDDNGDDCSQQPTADGAADNFRAGVLSISRGEVRPLRWSSRNVARCLVLLRNHNCTQVAS